MSQKSYHKRDGDLEIMSEDGLTMWVYRADGQRLTIDMSEAEHQAEETAVVPSAAAGSWSVTIDNDSGDVIEDGEPLWVTEIEPILERLDGTSIRPDIDQKKKATVVAIARAEYIGETKASVFGRKDTCSREIYYKKWKFDPLFSGVEADVLQVMRQNRTDDELRSISQAAKKIREAAPRAAEVHIKLMEHANPFVALQASAKILNMASQETADKGQITLNVNAQQIADEIRQAEEELKEWQAQQSQKKRQIEAGSE